MSKKNKIYVKNTLKIQNSLFRKNNKLLAVKRRISQNDRTSKVNGMTKNFFIAQMYRDEIHQNLNVGPEHFLNVSPNIVSLLTSFCISIISHRRGV